MTQAFADPKSCSQCHASEAAGYASSGMARAFYRPQTKDTIDSSAKGREYYHAASGTYYGMTERGGRHFQRRWLQGFEGRPNNVEELQIGYIMGSRRSCAYLPAPRTGSDTTISSPLDIRQVIRLRLLVRTSAEILKRPDRQLHKPAISEADRGAERAERACARGVLLGARLVAVFAPDSLILVSGFSAERNPRRTRAQNRDATRLAGTIRFLCDREFGRLSAFFYERL